MKGKLALLVDAFDIIFMRACLLGIKRLAEALAREREAEPVPVT